MTLTDCLQDQIRVRIHKHPGTHHEWGQGTRNLRGLLDGYQPRTFFIEHQANQVSPGPGCSQSIRHIRDAANFYERFHSVRLNNKIQLRRNIPC